MKKHHFDYRFTYRAEYFRRKGKNKRLVFLTGLQNVKTQAILSTPSRIYCALVPSAALLCLLPLCTAGSR